MLHSSSSQGRGRDHQEEEEPPIGQDRMDFTSVMETFAEAWVAANTSTPLTEAAAASGRPSIPIRCVIERLSAHGAPANVEAKGPGPCPVPGPGDAAEGARSCGGATNGPSASKGTPPGAAHPAPATGTSDRPQGATTPPSAPSMGGSGPLVEQDSFAIIPSGVLFGDLVRTALLRLGYSPSEAVGAKGLIQLRNWKPLTFEQITDCNEATVSDILGDTSSSVTLRIRLFRPKANAANELKDKLLQILLAHSYSLLVNSGCPIDQPLLSSLCGRIPRTSGNEYEITEETRKKFDQWYLQQVFNHYRQIAALAAAQHHHQQQQQAVAAAVAATATRRPSNGQPVGLTVDVDTHNQSNIQINPTDAHNGPNGSPQQLHPQQGQQQHHQYVRTRIRTSFDPELELPKLHKWFSENQHPSRAQIQQYVKDLNSLESRRGRKPLDVNNVVYWFKNARAAHKRQELKFVNGGQSPNPNGSKSHMGSNEGHKDVKEENQEMEGKENGQEEGDGEESVDGCHEDSGPDGDGLEDDNSSQFSQTLDLSMRPIKRRRSESSVPSSPGNGPSNEAASGPGSGAGDKEELNLPEMIKSDEEEEEESDSDEKDYYSSAIGCHGQGVGGPAFYGNNVINGNGGPYLGVPFGNISVAGNSDPTLPDSPDGGGGGGEGRRIRRSRTFIDPMTEVPRLEQWFTLNTHPTHSQIVRYTEELNLLPYRHKFPKLEPKNIQFWFKNRRAKYKRLSLPSQTPGPATGPLSQPCPPPSAPSSISSTSCASSSGAVTSPTTTPTAVTSALNLNVERLVGH